ncbi:MAG: pyridoxal phosphate-dependent aminotransferase [Deltaproteobacteria bacterium]|nr:pyridoxal phosphate-dependent aminotransferase [Candidatus Anaeroferrophillus wilburensis]MBN2888449.1 pyridoxal phosphate-dependent aminotransferase [Deltaproteobacteria bacterium]
MDYQSYPRSRKAMAMKPFLAMDVLERAQELERQGRSIIHLEVGEPDFPTPEPVKKTALEALSQDKTHYTHSMGILGLRQAIVDHYQRRYGVVCSPDQVLVTSGTSPALLMSCAALLNPGNRMIITNPGYACYANFISFCDGIPDLVDVHEDDGFQYDLETVKSRLSPTTSGILINSPANPTGTLLSAERMQQIADLGIPVISDEIYHGLEYEGKTHSILEFTDNAFVLNGFSKLYAMTGWRLGYLIAPKAYIRTLQTMQQNFFIAASHFGQEAAITALESAEVQQAVTDMKTTYDQRRRYMIERVRTMGLGIKTEPTGAFYVFANAKAYCTSSYDFAFEILEKAGVGVTPGIDFGSSGEGFIRFTYANSMENIKEGMDRLEKFLADR